jgi:hypothetical protein
MDPLARVRAGQPLAIDADTWNALIDGAKAARANAAPGQKASAVALPVHPSLTCLVKYDESSIETLPAHSVVTLGDSLIALSGDDGDPHGVNRRPAFTLGTPTGPGSLVAVTLEPIQGQAIGRAVVSGLVVAVVDVSDEDHTRAVPIAGDTDKFESGDSGGYPIVYQESGTGEVYAVILLGAPGGGAAVTEEYTTPALVGYDVLTARSTWTTLQTIEVPLNPGNYLIWWKANFAVYGYADPVTAVQIKLRLRKRVHDFSTGTNTYTTCANTEHTAVSEELPDSHPTAEIDSARLRWVSGLWVGEQLGERGSVNPDDWPPNTTHYELEAYVVDAVGTSIVHSPVEFTREHGMVAWQITGPAAASPGGSGGLTATYGG